MSRLGLGAAASVHPCVVASPFVDLHRLAEARSLAYHRVIAERIAGGRVELDRHLARLVEWRSRGLVGAAYLDRWAALLSGPRDVLCAALVRDDEELRALRQTTPFAGVSSPAERWEIWRRGRHAMEVREGARASR